MPDPTVDHTPSNLDPAPASPPSPEPAPRPAPSEGAAAVDPGASAAGRPGPDAGGEGPPRPKRRRGSRGGRSRGRGPGGDAGRPDDDAPDGAGSDLDDDRIPELPDRHFEGKPQDPAVAERALVKRPKIGDSRPAPVVEPGSPGGQGGSGRSGGAGGGRARKGGAAEDGSAGQGSKSGSRRRRGGRGKGSGGGRPSGPAATPVEAILGGDAPELDEETLDRRRGRERKGRPVGRYLMAVSVRPTATQIAVLEGRNLIEHYVSRPADDVAQIHGNIYLGKVQNVLPGMEAAFVDIATPKNAVLYRGDVQYDAEDIEKGGNARIEQILKPKQTIICQVTKNPIAHKGARLTQEVSLPGRFVVLIPNSSTYGISKRLADDERKRLRSILDKVKPPQHGVIVRTAAEGVTSEEISADVTRLLSQWEQIEQLAAKVQSPALLYREPDMAVRVIREEFNDDYRGIVIDDQQLYTEVRDYVASISPALADRVQFFDPATEPLSIFERHHVHEQLHKALDPKVWLPSGGSLIIEHTEALTVIDVNTGKNVGSSSLEETVFRNNLEAAVEIAKQLRLRDIGGIIVIDFIDMEIRKNRDEVITVFRDALARDKTRTQVFDISELGLVEMTRKRIGEGLLESFSSRCPECEGRGLLIDRALLD
ncbi:MAG: Rne/Rng family ribonuclease [Acidimicrobiales bacterium]|jgi:ribonuclease E|nr:Rne/Rng family ribonuclease [Acidimicrobiales bacterium]